MSDDGLDDFGAAGLLEVPLSMATGAYGQVDALANQGLLRLLGGSPEFAKQQADRIQAEDTYQPRTAWGRNALNLLSNTFESAANSKPIAAIADPITNALTSAGVAPGDISGLTGAAGLLLGPEAARVGGAVADSVKSAAADFARGSAEGVSRIVPQGAAPSVALKSLPADMQDMLHQLMSVPVDKGGGLLSWREREPPQALPTTTVNVKDIPQIAFDEDDRGPEYAREMDLSKTPPVIIANGQFLDGRHRAFIARERGVQQLPAIDLSGIIDPEVVNQNSMGRLARLGSPFPQYAEGLLQGGNDGE